MAVLPTVFPSPSLTHQFTDSLYHRFNGCTHTATIMPLRFELKNSRKEVMLEALAVAFHDPSIYGAVTFAVHSYWVLCTAAAVVALLPPWSGLNWFRYVTRCASFPSLGSLGLCSALPTPCLAGSYLHTDWIVLSSQQRRNCLGMSGQAGRRLPKGRARSAERRICPTEMVCTFLRHRMRIKRVDYAIGFAGRR